MAIRKTKNKNKPRRKSTKPTAQSSVARVLANDKIEAADHAYKVPELEMPVLTKTELAVLKNYNERLMSGEIQIGNGTIIDDLNITIGRMAHHNTVRPDKSIASNYREAFCALVEQWRIERGW